MDLSVAFDTSNHQALLQRMESHFGIRDRAWAWLRSYFHKPQALLQCMQSRFGIRDRVLAWLRSYFHERHQHDQINNTTSEPITVTCSAPQGSVLGPLAFTMYSSPLEEIVKAHNLHCMIYAHDTQGYDTFKPSNSASISSVTELCIKDIKCYMTKNMLKLNDSKTEILHLHSRHIPFSPLPSLQIGDSEVGLAPSARNLGIVIDNSVTMSQHVSSICKSASFALYKIGKLCRFLDQASVEKLVHVFVTSRLDNCNFLLFGLPACELDDKLKRIQNAAVRLVSRVNGQCHMKLILCQLHWLPIRKRIMFKIILITFKAIQSWPHSWIYPGYHYHSQTTSFASIVITITAGTSAYKTSQDLLIWSSCILCMCSTVVKSTARANSQHKLN